MQSNKKSFKGQNIFVGIDVHLLTWHVTAITESGFVYPIAIKADAEVLFDTLNRKFPDAHYIAAYEAGFSGFSTYYALEEMGIETIVVNAADIPTTEKEREHKTDAVDSGKIAWSLKRGELTGIYVRDKAFMDDSNLMRLRKRLILDLGRQKNRLKHLLYTQGVRYPDRFKKSGTHWSRAFMDWLRDEVKLLSEDKETLLQLVKYVEEIRNRVLEVTRKIRELSRSEKYSTNYGLLMSVPGIGPIVAMSLLTELDNNYSRFSCEKKFVSYLGLVPTCHDSGPKQVSGEMTHRGNKLLGPLIVESSWVAIQRDCTLAACYGNYCQYMKEQKAIVKIARKLACRIFAVLKNQKKYVQQ